MRIYFRDSTATKDIDQNNCDNCFLCYNPCDPYLKVKIDGVSKFRTDTMWDNNSPYFEATYVSERISKDSKITIEMWDDDAGDTSDDLMSRWGHLRIDRLTSTEQSLIDRENKIRIYSTWESE